tara:strand:+ start:1098 stop:1574 length:477 start_codon:yes stop_codon:yes gene_type:complete
MKIIKKSAVFSTCKTYRYSLTRKWDLNQKLILFIGLNPSTADENDDDPTIKRCMRYAYKWGYGGLIMANLFAFRATLPSDLKKANRPTGVDNNKFIIEHQKESAIVVVAWGNDGALYNRDKEVLELITRPMCLKVNKSGQPAHPLYQKKDLSPIQYSG